MTDSELIAQTAHEASGAKAAAEGVGADVAMLVAEVSRLVADVTALRADLAATRAELRDAIVLAATDMDSDDGATYLVQGLGAGKTWIKDGEQWADLVNEFPWLGDHLKRWAHRTLDKIPTIGESPPS